MSEAWKRDAEAIRAARPRHLLFLCVRNSAKGVADVPPDAIFQR